MAAHSVGIPGESDDESDDEFGGEPPRSWSDANAQLDAAFTAAYEELRRLARAIRRSDPGATIDPTALVNEAWLKLSASPHFAAETPLHFRRIAGRAMRQVLVEAARRRQAAKRGGPDAIVVTLDDQLNGSIAVGDDFLKLHEALEQLARLHPRQANIVEMRFFAGLGVAETAVALEVSDNTVARDWRAARAWLGDLLNGDE